MVSLLARRFKKAARFIQGIFVKIPREVKRARIDTLGLLADVFNGGRRIGVELVTFKKGSRGRECWLSRHLRVGGIADLGRAETTAPLSTAVTSPP